MMAAQLSGEITLYTAFSSIRTVLPTPRASAPPLPPSPMQTTITGTGRRDLSRRLRGRAFRLPALCGVDPGVGARGIQQGNHGAAELGGDLHCAQGLAVAFRLRHAEVPIQLL